MSKLENVYPYTDLLSYAELNKISSWNETIELFIEEGWLPFYESRSTEIYPSDDAEDFKSPKVMQIINGFCKKEKISYITIIDS